MAITKLFLLLFYVNLWISTFAVDYTITAGVSIPWTIKESVELPEKVCFTCTGPVKIESINPTYCYSCFDTWAENNVNCLYYVPGATLLEFDIASSYTIDVSCADTGSPITGTVNLGVVPNFPPQFNSPSGTIRIDIDPTMTADALVTSLAYTDTDDTIHSFSLTQFSNNGFFMIDSYGKIYALKDLNTFCDEETVQVSLDDHHNPAVYLTIIFDPGLNIKPVLNDWNKEISFSENKNVHVFTSDRLNKPGTCIVESDPEGILTSDLNLANCPAGATKSSSIYFNTLTYNYEVDPPLNLTLQYNNGNCQSNKKWLFIHWTDVPEKPILHLLKPEYNVNEGFIQVKPEYVIDDEDFNEKHVYSFVGFNNPKFVLDLNTGTLITQQYLLANSEVDVYSFSVQVTDKDGLTSDPVTISIRVSDVNDHAPVLGPIPKSYEATECHSPQKFLTVTASDEDYGINKEFKFVSVTSGSLLMNEAGELYLIKAPIAGQKDELSVQAIDKGEPPLLSTKWTVTLYGRPCPTTPPPPPPVTYPPTTQPPPQPTTTPTVTTQPQQDSGTSCIYRCRWSLLLLMAALTKFILM